MQRVIDWSHKLASRLLEILKSKTIVILALLSLAIGGFLIVNKSSAAGDPEISRVYQYYLLANDNGAAPAAANSSGESGDDKDSGKTMNPVKAASQGAKKAMKGMLGNGGNYGTFTYQDIVSANPDEKAAKHFSEIMATLSSYHFITVTSGGVTSMFTNGIRGLCGLVLMIFGLFIDIFTLIQTTIVNLLGKYNPYVLLGTLWGNTSMASDISGMLGITTDTLKRWATAFLVIFTGIMVWSLTAMLQRASQIDQAKRNKLLGRLVGFVAMPIVIIGACTLLAEAGEITNNDNQQHASYANWIMDVGTWAEKKRFDTGTAFDGISLSADPDHGKYVDTKFNPYAGALDKNGQSYAARLGQNLYNAGPISSSGTVFPNATIALNYMLCGTVSPSDYLSYVMTHDLNGKSYDFGKDQENVYNFEDIYDSNGEHKVKGDAAYNDYNNGNNPMLKAKDDYITDKKKHVQKWKKVWVDRYIYGAKHDGQLSKYYKEQPSGEQVYSYGGIGSEHSQLSYESTYYVLNTKFTNTGGTFSLDGPTYGAYSTIAKFDSNRYAYYNYSMVGTAWFTIPAMLTDGLIQGLVTLALVVVIFSIGITDMFLKPFRVWVKGSTFGDIEYTYAQLAYAMGLLGTIVALDVMPSVISDLLTGFVRLLAEGLTGNLPKGGDHPAAADATNSLMVGMSYIFSAALSAVAWLAYWKNWGGLRDKLTELMTIPWDWASRKGQQLEDMVSSHPGAMEKAKERHQQQRDKREGFLKGIAGNQTGLGRGLNRVTGGLAGKAATGALSAANKLGAYGNIDDRDNPVSGGKSQRELNADEIRRLGANGRIGKALREFSNVSTPSAKEIANDFAKNAGDNLSEEALMNPDGTFDENNDYVDSETADAMEQYNQATYGDLDEGERQRMNELHDKMSTDGLSSAEAEELKELENKAANGNNRLAATQAMDKSEMEGAKALKGVESNKQPDFDEKNKQLKKALGADGFNEYERLIAKQAQGEKLSESETKRFRDLTKEALNPENANAMSKGALMDRNEMQRKNARKFSDSELADMGQLQALRRAEMSRAPLSAADQTAYKDLVNKRNKQIESKMSTEALNELKGYENQTVPLTSEEQDRYNVLRRQADEIGNSALEPNELATFNKLNAQAGPKMTNGQRQALEQYTKRAKMGMSAPQRKRYKIDNQSIGSETQRLREQRNKVVDMAQSMTHQNQARNERQAASEATKAQIKQAMDAYQTFQRNPNQQAATALSDTLNRTRDSLQSVHASKATMDTFNSTADTVASELKNYNYASRGNVDSNGDGVMDGTQGVYDRVRRNVGKDTDALNKSLSQLSSGGAQQVRNSQPAQPRTTMPRSSNNGSVGQAQRMTNSQSTQPRMTTPRSSNNGSVGQTQRMSNPTSQNTVGNSASKPLPHKSTRVDEVHPPRSNQPRR